MSKSQTTEHSYKKLGLALAILTVAAILIVLILFPDLLGKDTAVSYEVLNTVEYNGSLGTFSQQTSGTLVVNKQPLDSKEIAYSYAFIADVTADNGKTVAEISFPAVSIVRDTSSDRIIGGDRLLKNLGLV